MVLYTVKDGATMVARSLPGCTMKSISILGSSRAAVSAAVKLVTGFSIAAVFDHKIVD
jgi:hypothetical protein